MKIFIDTSAFVALFVESEIDHKKVSKKYYQFRQERVMLFTSFYILDELFTRLLFYKNINIKELIRTFKAVIAQKEITVLQIDETIFEKSIEIFLKFSEHKISFTDATTCVLYKEFNIDEIFTLDSDFTKMRAKTSF